MLAAIQSETYRQGAAATRANARLNVFRAPAPIEHKLQKSIRAERRQNDEKLRAYQKHINDLAMELLIVEERERSEFASKLHDGIGQDLAYLLFKLKMR